MSLIATASLWNNNDSIKRNPTMRKTMKKMPSLEKDAGKSEEEAEEEEEIHNERPTTFIEDQELNSDRSERVNKLLNNMSSVLHENDGNKLADFNPIPLPNIQKKTDTDIPTFGRNGDKQLPPLPNHLQLHPPKIVSESSNFGPSGQDLGNSQENPYSNYRKIYEPSRMLPPTQHNGQSLNVNASTIDNKLLEKINYMVYMLEQQQNEKTSNITEEFVLYTFLGVFIIFIVDSFARTGKYIR